MKYFSLSYKDTPFYESPVSFLIVSRMHSGAWGAPEFPWIHTNGPVGINIQTEWKRRKKRCEKAYEDVFMRQDFGLGGGFRDGPCEKRSGAAPMWDRASFRWLHHSPKLHTSAGGASAKGIEERVKTAVQQLWARSEKLREKHPCSQQGQGRRRRGISDVSNVSSEWALGWSWTSIWWIHLSSSPRREVVEVVDKLKSLRQEVQTSSIVQTPSSERREVFHTAQATLPVHPALN